MKHTSLFVYLCLPRHTSEDTKHPSIRLHFTVRVPDVDEVDDGPDTKLSSRLLLVLIQATPLPESKEMTEQIDWRKKQPSQAGCVSEDLKWRGA